MQSRRTANAFQEHVDLLSNEDPQALLLGWWCRLERALNYYYIAYLGEHPRSAFQATQLVAKDVRIAPAKVSALHVLRIKRNRLAHGRIAAPSAQEAAEYAAEANALIWHIGNCVPDDLAITSGAAVDV